MTDHEKVESLFLELGIGYKINPPYLVNELNGYSDEKVIVCEEGEAKIVGYGGFFTTFIFDKCGNFIRMGIGE